MGPWAEWIDHTDVKAAHGHLGSTWEGKYGSACGTEHGAL